MRILEARKEIGFKIEPGKFVNGIIVNGLFQSVMLPSFCVCKE